MDFITTLTPATVFFLVVILIMVCALIYSLCSMIRMSMKKRVPNTSHLGGSAKHTSTSGISAASSSIDTSSSIGGDSGGSCGGGGE